MNFFCNGPEICTLYFDGHTVWVIIIIPVDFNRNINLTSRICHRFIHFCPPPLSLSNLSCNTQMNSCNKKPSNWCFPFCCALAIHSWISSVIFAIFFSLSHAPTIQTSFLFLTFQALSGLRLHPCYSSCLGVLSLWLLCSSRTCTRSNTPLQRCFPCLPLFPYTFLHIFICSLI